ncbi:MAG TPA: C1 family peptidase [Planctomycetota bacterium]|nr:C1 family peptidase [Planctomycetota bacterium]
MAVRKKKQQTRTLDVRRDTLDFRDRMYVANLCEVPTQIPLEAYKKRFVHGQPHILDQGKQGACTGFGLAAVANALLTWRRVVPDATPVSARMLYEMARRYDEWPGERYEGSSARGAMKGWHKHGVCSAKMWPHTPGKKRYAGLDAQRAADGLKRPLGAYYRVNHKDLVAMHAAMAEVGVLYATATVHGGWDEVGPDGAIPYPRAIDGGHAFALVGYDEHGFWIQNSWGEHWGRGGFARVSYDDWLENGTDVWVARLGAPVVLTQPASTAIAHSAAAHRSAAYTFADLRPHIVSIGNDGLLEPGGDYGTSAADVETVFAKDIPARFAQWQTGDRHLLLYAHGGLVGEDSAVQRVADYREAMLGQQIYPLSFIWHSDFWTTCKNILEDAVRRRRPEGMLDSAKDFMLDRFDDALEPIARVLGGRAQWQEMQENAEGATSNAEGGARLVGKLVGKLVRSTPRVKVHLVGHSAGSIFLGPLARLLAQGGVAIESCTMWAPACTTALFDRDYAPAIERGAIGRFALFTLTDRAEQDDSCAGIYHKSLLYLVSNALEDKPRIPIVRDGVALLGMEKFAKQHERLTKLIAKKKVDWIRSPNTARPGSPDHSTAREHGAFDDDQPTLVATMARMLGKGGGPETFAFQRSASSMRDRRQAIER